MTVCHALQTHVGGMLKELSEVGKTKMAMKCKLLAGKLDSQPCL